MSVTRPIVAAPGKWTILWTASRGAGHANYRGFTHRRPRNRGSLPRISGQRVVKGRQNCESGPSRGELSGFHPPFDNTDEIGSAWCRERVCQIGYMSVVVVSFKKKKRKRTAASTKLTTK